METRQARSVATSLLYAGVSWAALATGAVALSVDTWKFAPAFLLVSAGAAVLLLRGPLRRRPSSWTFPLLLLLPVAASLLPSFLWTKSHDLVYLTAVRLACVCVAAVVVEVARRPRRLLWIGWVVAAVLTVLCVVGVLEYFGLVLWRLNSRWQAVGSLAYHPNIYAGLILLLFPPAAAALWSLRPALRRVALPALLILAVWNLAASGSRAAMIGLCTAVCAGVVGLFVVRRGSGPAIPLRRLVLPLCGVLVLLCLAAFLLPATREKILGLSLRDNPRWVPYGIAFRIWTQSPRTVFFGNGLGAFGSLWPSFRAADFRVLTGDMGWDAVHNEYLEILVDGGLVALGLSALVAGWLLVRTLRLLRSRLPPGIRLLGAGFALALLAFMVDALFSTNARTAFVLLVAAVDAAALAVIGSWPSGARTARRRHQGTEGAPRRSVRVACGALGLVALVALDALFGLRLASEVLLAAAAQQPQARAGLELAARACVLAPRSVYPWYERARLALQAGDAVQCLAAIEETEHRVPYFKDTGLMAGLACVMRDEWQDAVERLEGYLDRDRYDLKAQAYLLVVELAQGRIDAAMGGLRRIMQSDEARSQTAGRFTVSFPPGDSVRVSREGEVVRLELGEQAGRSALEAIMQPTASSLNVYLFRLHYLLGRTYGGAGLRSLAVQHLAEARAHLLAGGTVVAEEDERRYAELVPSVRAELVALADESRRVGNEGSETSRLESYLALGSDETVRRRLVALCRRRADFKALRRLEAGRGIEDHYGANSSE